LARISYHGYLSYGVFCALRVDEPCGCIYTYIYKTGLSYECAGKVVCQRGISGRAPSEGVPFRRRGSARQASWTRSTTRALRGKGLAKRFLGATSSSRGRLG